MSESMDHTSVYVQYTKEYGKIIEIAAKCRLYRMPPKETVEGIV
jgi:hypothetical protein